METHSSCSWLENPHGQRSLVGFRLTRLKQLSSNSSLKLSVCASPTLPSPLATTSLFSMSVDLFLFHKSSFVSLIAQLVKNPPAMQETPVRVLGQEDPLEKG